MKHILVPTDFSIASGNACEYAASLAQSFGAKITLVHVFAPPLVIDDISAASLIVSHDELVEQYQDLLESKIQLLSKKYQVEIDSKRTNIQDFYSLNIIPSIAKICSNTKLKRKILEQENGILLGIINYIHLKIFV